MAVDARQMSTASETVVSWTIHRKSECVTTSVRKWVLRPTTRLFIRDLQITDTRTPSIWGTDVSSRPGLILRKEVLRQKLRSAEVRIGYRQRSVTSTEMAGGSPPADIDICEGLGRLQTYISATSTEMAGGSPPAYVDICVIPDVLPIAKSVKTVMSDKSMMMDTPDGVVTRTT